MIENQTFGYLKQYDNTNIENAPMPYAIWVSATILTFIRKLGMTWLIHFKYGFHYQWAGYQLSF